jgi:hypothetical protein
MAPRVVPTTRGQEPDSVQYASVKEVFCGGGFMDELSRQKGETNPQAPKEGAPVAAPSISLPKGGGAIRGMGEKFAANPVTGTGSMTVPIATSPGRSGFGPQLSLSYDSGAGNGPFGLGWNLSLPSITRKTDKVYRNIRMTTNQMSSFCLGRKILFQYCCSIRLAT